MYKCLLPSSSPSTFQKLNRRQLVTCRPIILMTTATTISRCRPKKGQKYQSYIFLLHIVICDYQFFLLIDVQISKSPPEKPLVSIRPSSVGSSVVPIKMEDMKTERVLLSSVGGSVESPVVEQPFIQRKQKYSSSLCQPDDKNEIIACDCFSFVFCLFSSLFVCFVFGMAHSTQ